METSLLQREQAEQWPAVSSPQAHCSPITRCRVSLRRLADEYDTRADGERARTRKSALART